MLASRLPAPGLSQKTQQHPFIGDGAGGGDAAQGERDKVVPVVNADEAAIKEKPSQDDKVIES